MPRCAKSFHRTVLMLPSGFIANEPPPGPLWPVSVFAETAPSTVAMKEGLGAVQLLLAPVAVTVLVVGRTRCVKGHGERKCETQRAREEALVGHLDLPG